MAEKKTTTPPKKSIKDSIISGAKTLASIPGLIKKEAVETLKEEGARIKQNPFTAIPTLPFRAIGKTAQTISEQVVIPTFQEIGRASASAAINVKAGLQARQSRNQYQPQTQTGSAPGLSQRSKIRKDKPELDVFDQKRIELTKAYNDAVFGAGSPSAYKSFMQGVTGRPISESQAAQAAEIASAAVNIIPPLRVGKGIKAARAAAEKSAQQIARDQARQEAIRVAREVNKTPIRAAVQSATFTADKAVRAAANFTASGVKTGALGATMGFTGAIAADMDVPEAIEASVVGAGIGWVLGSATNTVLGADGKLSKELVDTLNRQAEQVKFLNPATKEAYERAKRLAEKNIETQKNLAAKQAIVSKKMTDDLATKKYKNLRNEIKTTKEDLKLYEGVTDEVSLAEVARKQQRIKELQAQQKELKPQVTRQRFQKARAKTEEKAVKADENLYKEIRAYAKKNKLKVADVEDALVKKTLKGKDSKTLRQAYKASQDFNAKVGKAAVKASAEESSTIKAANKVATLDLKIENIKSQLDETTDAVEKKVLEKNLKTLEKTLERETSKLKSVKNFNKNLFDQKRTEKLVEKRIGELDAAEEQLARELGITRDQVKEGLKVPSLNKDITATEAPFYINTKEGVAIPRATWEAAINAAPLVIPGLKSLRRAFKIMDGQKVYGPVVSSESFGILYKTVYQPILESFKKREQLIREYRDRVNSFAPEKVAADSAFATKWAMTDGKGNKPISAKSGSLLSRMVQMRGMKMEKDNVKWNALSKQDQKLVDDVVAKYNEMYDDAWKMLNDELVSLGKNKIILKRKDYFPVFSDENVFTELTKAINSGNKTINMNEVVSAARNNRSVNKVTGSADIKASFKNKRESNIVPIFDAYGGAMRYIPQMARVVAFTRTMQYLRALNGTEPGKGAFSGQNWTLVNSMINEMAGLPTWTKEKLAQLSEFTLTPATRAAIKSTAFIFGEARTTNAANALRNNTAYQVIRAYNTFRSIKQLGFSAGNGLLQLSQMAFPIAMYGPGRVAAGALPFSDELTEMWTNSATRTLRMSRHAEFDLNKISSVAMFLTTQTDNWTVRTSWRAAASAALDSGASKEAATMYADDIVDNLYASTVEGLASRAATNQVIRLVLPFRSFLINQVQMYGEAAQNWGKTKTGQQALKILAASYVTTELANEFYESIGMSKPFPRDLSSLVWWLNNPRFERTDPVTTTLEALDNLSALDAEGLRIMGKAITPRLIRDLESAYDIFNEGEVTPLNSRMDGFKVDRNFRNIIKTAFLGTYSTEGGQEALKKMNSDPSWLETQKEKIFGNIFTNEDDPEGQQRKTYQNYVKFFSNPESFSEREIYEIEKKLVTIEETDPAEYEIARRAYASILPEAEDMAEMYEKFNRDELTEEETEEMVDSLKKIEIVDPDKAKEILKLIEEYENSIYIDPLF